MKDDAGLISLSVDVCSRIDVLRNRIVAVRLANMLNMITLVTCASGCGAEEAAEKRLLRGAGSPPGLQW